jgi:hypothetical protein
MPSEGRFSEAVSRSNFYAASRTASRIDFRNYFRNYSRN